MPLSLVLGTGLFCPMQSVASLSLEWSTTLDPHWLWGFPVGSVFRFHHLAIMLVYKAMSRNIALGTCGGAFLLSQLALAWALKCEVSLRQMDRCRIHRCRHDLITGGKSVIP